MAKSEERAGVAGSTQSVERAFWMKVLDFGANGSAMPQSADKKSDARQNSSRFVSIP